MLLGDDSQPAAAELDRWADSGVAVFLAAYGHRSAARRRPAITPRRCALIGGREREQLLLAAVASDQLDPDRQAGGAEHAAGSEIAGWPVTSGEVNVSHTPLLSPLAS